MILDIRAMFADAVFWALWDVRRIGGHSRGYVLRPTILEVV